MSKRYSGKSFKDSSTAKKPKLSLKEKLNITNLEYDYLIASEHINSIFNLISIIRYNYKNNIISEKYLPFKINIIDLNLFYNITLKK